MKNTIVNVISLATVIAALVAGPIASGEAMTPDSYTAARIATAETFLGQDPSLRPSDHLASLDRARMMDARIDIEYAGEAGVDSDIRVTHVENLWDSGRFEAALTELRTLEDQGLVAGVGIAWKNPQPVLPDKSGNALIDVTPADKVVLGHDTGTGHLFAAVRMGIDFGLYISVDRGLTWVKVFETDAFLAQGRDVDLTIAGGHVYVASSVRSNLSGISSAAIRRFSALTGAEDTSWGAHTVASHNDRGIKEISLETDGAVIFYVLLYDTNYIQVMLGQTNNGTAWAHHNPAITNALRGLDTSYPGESSPLRLCISYVGTNEGLYLKRLDDTWDYHDLDTITYDDGVDTSTVAAWGNHLVIAWSFEDSSSNSRRVKSLHASGLGLESVNWTVWPVWACGSGDCHDPLVAVSRANESNAIIYEREGSIVYRHSPAFTQYWPLAHTDVNNHPFQLGAGDRFAFEWLGQGYGIAYPSTDGSVYFFRTWLFSDGFDSGTASRWTEVVE